MLIRVSIPGHRKVKEDDDVYTVFTVDVWVSGRHHMVERRYSEFEDLHKQIKKMMKTPDFPPKKVLKWNNKVLEQRRHGLENYLQGVVTYEAVPKAVLEFLEITLEEDGMDFENPSNTYVPTHQAVVTFTEDAYLQDVNRGTLPDIIAEGVTIGLFDSDYTAFPS
ncbi:sorting nexin-24-like isoform X2 [Babylonia areolata]|uniref:sorting nexin-24-like isoform X2 n=1 Tax=Babylonia areolata TaxID=304850 RepID=UPI003FCF3B92